MKTDGVYTDSRGVVHGGEYDGMPYQDAYNMYAKKVKDKNNSLKGAKGSKIVQTGVNNFAKTYVEPTIKGIGSLTPVGPAIGLTDAYTAYKNGDTTEAVIRAGVEALPYVAKRAVKGAVKYAAPAISRSLGKVKVPSRLYKYVTHPETGIPKDIVGYHSVGKSNKWFPNDQFIHSKPDAYFKNKQAKFLSKELAPTGISKTGKRGIYAPTPNTKTYKVTTRFENPLVVDSKYGYNRDAGSEGFNTLLERATRNGHDGVIIKQTWDNQLDDIFMSTKTPDKFKLERFDTSGVPRRRYMDYNQFKNGESYEFFNPKIHKN